MPGWIPALMLLLSSAYVPITGSAGGQDAGETDIVAAKQDAYRRMTVPVRIGDIGTFRFLVDTGAQNTVVSNVLASRLALAPDGKAYVLGVAGGTVVDTVTLDNLGLGRRNFNRLVAPILDQGDIGADGIVGLDSLQNQRVLIDFTRNLIAIDDAEIGHDYGYDIVVRARRRSGQLIITSARLDGIPVDVVVDTGADSTIGNSALAAAFARRRISGTTILESVTGQQIAASFGVARTLDVGGMTIENIAVAYADAPPFAHLGLDKRPAILLGMRELRAFKRVAIDFSKRKVLFDFNVADGPRLGSRLR